VDVEEREANYINRTAPSMNNGFPFGEGVKLTGKQALVYSRIRKLDSDVERTRRQQRVIESMIRSAKGASLRQLYNFLEELLPYVTTNYTKAQLMALVPSGIGWVNFGMAKASFPMLEGEAANAVTGSLRGMFLVIADYPLASHQLQMALYGESNINLENDSERDEYIQSLFQSLTGRPQQNNNWQSSTEPATEPPKNGGGIIDFSWLWPRSKDAETNEEN